MDKTAPTDALAAFDGSLTVAAIVETGYSVQMVQKGKAAIADCASRLRQIAGLKPGSTSIRTKVMIDEILERLIDGQTLTTILCDVHMPSSSAFWNWCKADPDLKAAVLEAQAIGQRTLADLRMNIAMGGEFSTGDPRRDELLIKTINANIAQRNRPEFGERQQIDIAATSYILPPGADDY